MSPLLAFLLGAAGLAIIAIPIGLRLRGAATAACREAGQRGAEAQIARGLLAAAPSSFYAWHHGSGETHASGRLVVLLNLAGPSEPDLADILARFAPADRQTLEAAVAQLRHQGIGFGLDLAARDGRPPMRAEGMRTMGKGGKPVADALWLSPRDAAAEIPLAVTASEPVQNPMTAPPPPAVDDATSPDDVETAVLEHLATAVGVYDSERRLAYFNPAFARLWRLDGDWLASRPGLSELLERLRAQRRLPEFHDFREFREQQLAHFGSLDAPIEDLIHLPDGTTIRTIVAPRTNGGLVHSFEDVTDRLGLERSFNTLLAVHRATLDNLYEGVGVFGGDGHLKLSNPVFLRLWNLDAGEPLGKLHLRDFVGQMQPYFPAIEDWPAHNEKLTVRLMNRTAGSGRLVRADGSVLDYANVPLPDGAVLLSYLDVTDEVQVEQALRDRALAMQEANRLKSEFIANVSYEVRTPLTTIMGFAEILAGGHFGELNPRQLDYGSGILSSARTLTTVIEDILDLAAIDAGLMPLDLDAVDIHAMLASLLPLVQERVRHKTLKVEFDCPPDIGWIIADERRLKQVVFKLLGNAIDFSAPRGAVTLSAARGSDHLTVAVRDSGPGVPAADQDRLFEAFARGAAPDGSPPGAGLGLSLVKRFVELHGGTVTMKSAPKRGATVSFTLPTERAEAGDDASP
jgi:signal transduction histidine kinase